MAAPTGLDFRVGSSAMKVHYDTIAGNYARLRESEWDNIERLCLGIHLKGMEEYQAYLDLIPVRLPDGKGSTHCEECETVIPDARRKAIPGVRLCVGCQAEREKQG